MFRRLLREYLSLTHGERHGIQILSILIILLLLLRAFLPFLTETEPVDFSGTAEDFNSFQDSLKKVDALMAEDRTMFSATSISHESFHFDPNTVDLDELLLMGVSPGVARTLINYRAAGGIFDTDSDLMKVYGLSPRVFQRLQPYIRIVKTGDNLGFQSTSHQSTTTQYTTNQHTPFQSTITQHIPTQSLSPQSTAAHSSPAPFELNRADSLQLVSVYGIGPIFASRIIRYRDLLGGFCRQEQLDEVYGFTLQQHNELSRRCYIDTNLLRKIDLNNQDAGGFSRHPYINSYQAAALVSYRNQMGRYIDPRQIIENHLLPDSVYLRILPYLYTGQ